nr:Uncharacterized protein A9P81_3158 [Leptospira interrogans serovar Copenhageni/Icterohaemorrhagiae]
MKFGLLEYLKLKVVCDSFQVLEKQKGAFMNSMLQIKKMGLDRFQIVRLIE